MSCEMRIYLARTSANREASCLARTPREVDRWKTPHDHTGVTGEMSPAWYDPPIEHTFYMWSVGVVHEVQRAFGCYPQ